MMHQRTITGSTSRTVGFTLGRGVIIKFPKQKKTYIVNWEFDDFDLSLDVQCDDKFLHYPITIQFTGDFQPRKRKQRGDRYIKMPKLHPYEMGIASKIDFSMHKFAPKKQTSRN